jgi:hypothetical protein
MDWYWKLEDRRSSILVAVYLLATAILLVSTLRVFVGLDAFWHLQMGKDLIQNQLSPWIDHYSFTFKGAKISATPVIFQVLVYEFVRLFGEFNGFFAIRLTSFICALTMMSLWLRQIRAPVLVYCLVLPVLVVLLQLRAIVRPELFSYSLAILALILYQRTRLELSFRAMWPVAALLLFWTNYHSSILAYVIFFGLFVDIAIRLMRERSRWINWMQWAGWGVALIGIGFMNPTGEHSLLAYLGFPSEWKVLIQEYAPPKSMLRFPVTWVMIGMLLFTVFNLLKQKRIGLTLVALTFSYAAVTIGRMVTPAGTVLLCLFALVLSGSSLGESLNKASKPKSIAIAALSLVVFMVPLAHGVQQARGVLQENRLSLTGFPYEMTEYMNDGAKYGRIFNTYAIGGYLIYRLSPASEVYIDGRTQILYPLTHFQRMLEANAFPDTFMEEVSKYNIEYAVLDATEIYATLMHDAGFELDFVDIKYALWSRSEGSLSSAGTLWARPYCWPVESLKTVQDEWEQAFEVLPSSAPVLPLLSLALKFATSTDLDEFFKPLATDDNPRDSDRRFLAYRALETSRYEYAIDQFERMAEMRPKDYLAMAFARLQLDDPDSAESWLDRFSRVAWVRLEFSDVLIQHALLDEIAKKRPLKLFDSEYISELEEKVTGYSLPARGETIALDSFCQDLLKQEIQ